MKRLPIKDKEIIELYKTGYSQNDIVKQYDVSVIYTRSVLSAAGFNTRGFRALSPAAMRVIEALVKSGVRYIDIEAVCDLSFHAIRDYVKRSDCRSRKDNLLFNLAFSRMSEFLKAYRDGYSFCYLLEDMSIEDDEIFSAFQGIKEEDIAVHRDNLHSHIEKCRNDGLSDAGITQKLNISRSVVRHSGK